MSIIQSIKEYRQFREFIKDLDLTKPEHFFNDTFWTPLIGQIERGYVKPNDLATQMNAFWGDVFKCVDMRAKVCSGVGWGIYRAVGKTSKTKAQFKLTQCKDVASKKKDYIFSKGNLAHVLKSADSVEEIVNHPISDLLYRVNTIQNESSLKYLTIAFQDTAGNAYWKIIPSQAGIPAEIRFLYPQYMTANYDEFGEIVSYTYKTPKEEVVYDAKWIIHFMYDNILNMGVGLSPVSAACDTINEQLKMNELLAYLLTTRMRQDTMMINKGAKLNDDALRVLKMQWRQFVEGKDVTIPVFQGDLEPKPLSQSLKELPFLPNKKFNREQIYSIFGIPISYATMESSNRSTIDIASDRGFMGNYIKPILMKQEETINQSLINRFYTEDVFLVYDDCVPEDKEFILEKRKAELAGKAWKTPNEVRAEDGLEPRDGGDVLANAPAGKIEPLQMMVDDVIAKARQKIEYGV